MAKMQTYEVPLFCYRCGRTHFYKVAIGMPTRVKYHCPCGNVIPWQNFKDGDPNVTEQTDPHVVEQLRREMEKHVDAEERRKSVR
jgi:hypothetical protein